MTSTEELLASLNRSLPYSEEAEKGVISCLLQRPELLNECPSPAAFYHEGTRTIYEAMHELAAKGKPIEPVALTLWLREKGLLDKVGGAAEISDLYGFTPISAHFPFYRKIVMEKFTLREIIRASALNIVQAYEHGKEQVDEDVATVLDEAARRLQNAREVSAIEESAELPSTPLRELIMQVVDDAELMANSGRQISGLSTGIPPIDDIMGGLEPGCLTVVAAESSDGKSSLCRQMLEAVASDGHCAIDYTYEMMPKTEARRILCSQGRIDAHSLKMGIMTRGEQGSLAAQSLKVSKWDMHIVDVAGKTIEQICRDIARRAKKMPEGKRIVALIDYIQLCKTSADSRGNREREVAHITSTAKQCAKMTGAHILMPSQQNKEGDVRESMAIEQDADTLIQIQKIKAVSKVPAYKQQPKEEEPNNVRRVFFKKVRDGERYKHVTMELVGRHFRFEVVREPEEKP